MRDRNHFQFGEAAPDHNIISPRIQRGNNVVFVEALAIRMTNVDSVTRSEHVEEAHQPGTQPPIGVHRR